MTKFLPWVVGVIVLAVAGYAWLEYQEKDGFEKFVERVRYGDEGPLERAGRKIDEKIEDTVEKLKDD